MRQPNKNRSRKNNNRRSLGNVSNRVFDSAGPDGKVRGTPSQVIAKYQTLTRDAQLAGDRVAAENFQQHAEHYVRLLAQSEAAERERREAAEQRNAERKARDNEEQPSIERAQERPQERAPERRGGKRREEAAGIDGFVVGDGAAAEEDIGLVDTPESQNKAATTTTPLKDDVAASIEATPK